MSIFSIFSKSAPTNKPAVESASKPAPKTEIKEQPKPVVATKPVTQVQPDPQVLEQAEARAREIVLEAKDEAFKIKDGARQDAHNLQRQLDTKRQELMQKQQELSNLQARLEERDRITKQQTETIEKKLETVENLRSKITESLEEVSGMTKLEAKEKLLEEVERRSVGEIAKVIKSAEEKARAEADTKAKEILVDSMFSGATEYVPEYTITTIKVPDEETKGKIIGKEGRNIRTFEKITGIDVILDEPNVIKLSSFDSVRREIARVALERLIRDGRIHPTHIEEFVDKARKDVERIMYQEGEKLCHLVGVYDLPRDLVAMLGRFKYRTSYGQNMIAHTLEETKIGMKLAAEVGADVRIVKLGCLLHDIGKIVTEEEGSHVELGVKLLKKYNVPKAAVDAVAQHHEDEEFTSIESVIVYIADAISGSRPGARYENYEEYVERLNKLEEIAKKHPEVEEAYAIQAGREVRVIVRPDKISDAQMVKLASDIKTEVQETMTYPGTVKVTIIRETRASDIAK